MHHYKRSSQSLFDIMSSTWVISYLRFVLKNIYFDNQFEYHFQFRIKHSKSKRSRTARSSSRLLMTSFITYHFFSERLKPLGCINLCLTRYFTCVIKSRNWVRNHRLPFHFHDRVILTIRLANQELYSPLSFVQYKFSLFPLI